MADTPDWVIYTTLRRRWPDGTEFTIRPASPHEPRCLTATEGFQLTISTTHGLRAHSWHPDVPTAQAHADELLASFSNPKLDDYRVPEIVEQDDLFGGVAHG